MGTKNEKYKNKLEMTRDQKHKFSHTLTKLPKGKHYIDEMDPLIGSVINIECDNWVIIPSKIEGVRCDRLNLKSAVIVKCPNDRNVEVPLKISKKLWTVIDSDLKTRIGIANSKDKYRPVISGTTLIQLRGFVYEHRISIHGVSGNYIKKNIGLQCLSVRKVEE